MAKANTTNEIVYIDLKEVGEHGKEILYMVDKLSMYIQAEIISNKKPETVIKTFNRRWVREGPGLPSRGIFSDNKGEFKNPQMKEMAAKHGLTIFFTTANSPWSNGRNGRNHYTVHKTIAKLMEEDHEILL